MSKCVDRLGLGVLTLEGETCKYRRGDKEDPVGIE